jgi:hypothetical protein
MERKISSNGCGAGGRGVFSASTNRLLPVFSAGNKQTHCCNRTSRGTLPASDLRLGEGGFPIFISSSDRQTHRERERDRERGRFDTVKKTLE